MPKFSELLLNSMNEAKKVKLKKYPWNEPEPDKRHWNDENYSRLLMKYILLGRQADPRYGNVDDLNPKMYDATQMKLVSFGRGAGANTIYGNIDDLNPKMYDGDQMEYISLGRGSDSKYGNIDDLDPSKIDAEDMKNISKERGKK